jgi:hypothetical protein
MKKMRRLYIVQAEMDDEGTEITLHFLSRTTRRRKVSHTFGFGIGHSPKDVQLFWNHFFGGPSDTLPYND